MIRVAVNGQFLAEPYTGVGRYVRELLTWFDHSAEVDAIAYAPVSVTRLGNSRLGRVEPLATPFDRLHPDLAKLFSEQIAFPLRARRDEPDLYHYPHFAAPLVGARPLVVTVHDVIPLIMPQYATSGRVRAYMALTRRAVRRAKAVLVDSNASRNDVVHVLGLCPDRVFVAPLAIDSSFRQDVPETEVADVRRRYGLPEEYLLYLGAVDYRKNIANLLHAYALARKQGLSSPLVLVARIPPPGPLFPDVVRLVDELGLGGHVLLPGPGRVTDNPALLAGSLGFVFPSRYEGFGLPPLEAMACGVPVACSNAASLPEVVGDSALLFDPDDLDGIADCLIRLAGDRELRSDLGRRGAERSRLFSWDRTADLTVRAYHQALGLQSGA